jgi:paraquat-inducible protein A
MIDVFMLSILTALVRMGIIASVTPGYGAVAFASVVVLTMLAALSFDPRLMWDAAEAGQRVTEEDVEDGAGVRA